MYKVLRVTSAQGKILLVHMMDMRAELLLWQILPLGALQVHSRESWPAYHMPSPAAFQLKNGDLAYASPNLCLPDSDTSQSS